MVDDGKHPGRERPANDNRPPDGRNDGHAVDASERLDRVVLTNARLIGTQIAREHFATLQAANDNRPPLRDGAGQDAGDED